MGDPTVMGRSHPSRNFVGEVPSLEKLILLSLALITSLFRHKAGSACAAGVRGGHHLPLLFPKLRLLVSYNAAPAFWEHGDVSTPVLENTVRKIVNTLFYAF